MTSRLTKENIASVFSVFDSNGTGTIDATELELALKALGFSNVSSSEIEEKFSIVGKTSSSELSLDEFSIIVSADKKEPDTVGEARAVFNMFDGLGAGKLSPAALKAIGQRVTGYTVSDKLVNDIMLAVDQDRDGFISFPEFCRAVLKGTPGELGAEEELAALGNVKRSGTLGNTDPPSDEGALAKGSADAVTEIIGGVSVTFRDGKISKSAVRDALRSLDYGDAALPAHVYDDLFAESDADNDGHLTRDEYCVLLVSFGEVIDGY